MINQVSVFGLNIYYNDYDTLIQWIKEKLKNEEKILIVPISLYSILFHCLYIRRLSKVEVDYYYIDSWILHLLFHFFYRNRFWEKPSSFLISLIENFNHQKIFLTGISQKEFGKHKLNIRRFNPDFRFTGFVDTKISHSFRRQTQGLIKKINPKIVFFYYGVKFKQKWINFIDSEGAPKSGYIFFSRNISMYIDILKTNKRDWFQIRKVNKLFLFVVKILFFPVYLVGVVFFIIYLTISKKGG